MAKTKTKANPKQLTAPAVPAAAKKKQKAAEKVAVKAQSKKPVGVPTRHRLAQLKLGKFLLACCVYELRAPLPLGEEGQGGKLGRRV